MNWENLLSNQRRGEKPKKHDISRSAFEQDFDRIIFSHPFRRLQDKTQVHPLPEQDFVHNRLTHSLEVSSVARSLGKKAGQVILERNPELATQYSAYDFGAIVAAAALTHDIGNPPFGHSGEDAISEYFKYGSGSRFKELLNNKQWADLTSFEGNAQGFRILNKDRYQGLRLTYATLAAFSKYPRESVITNRDEVRRSQKKYGFFQSEKEIFKAIAEETGLIKYQDFVWSRHPLTFLVEAADDICYNLIDLEDGCRLGLVSYDETVDLFAEILQARFDRKKLNKIESKDERVGTLRALGVGVLIEQCTELFLDNEKQILEGTYDTALANNIPSTAVLNDVIAISVEKIYRSPLVVETEAAGFEVLPGLMDAFSNAAFETYFNNTKSKKYQTLLRLLPPETTKEIADSKNDLYGVLMACVDFVSGLTDTHAISLFRKIKGISHPNI